MNERSYYVQDIKLCKRGGGEFLASFKCFQGCNNKKICYNVDVKHHNHKGLIMTKITGFTLAEVLITLGVIGVVAAMTMPSLINHYREKETITKLKKFQSIMNQAYNTMIADNDTIENWGLTSYNDEESAKLIFSKFKPYLKVAKDCGVGVKGCFPDVNYKLLSGGSSINFITDQNKRYMFILADGATGAFLSNTISFNSFEIYYDVNGAKPPNQFGKDLFQFSLRSGTNYIAPSVGDGTMESCYDKGYNCASWVLTYENMDYLHCKDLEFDGKTTCK